MLEKLLSTRPGTSLFLIRITVGVIFVAHGAQKLLGWFGGKGLEGTVEAFTQLGILYPDTTAWLVAVIELAGGCLMLIGFFTREAALLNAIVMVGAIVTVHGKNGFFMQDNGYEYNVLLIASCLALLRGGAGAFSIDRILFPRERWRFVKDPGSIKLEPPSDPLVF